MKSWDTADLRLVATRERQLLLSILGVIILFFLSVALCFALKIPLIVAGIVTILSNLVVAYLSYRLVASARFKWPIIYPLGLLFCSFFTPIMVLVFIALTMNTVHNRVFKPNGIKIGFLGPNPRIIQ